MKKISIYLAALLAMFSLVRCTGNFEDFNTDSYGVTDEQASFDFNNIGSYFQEIQRGIAPLNGSFQVSQHLHADVWSQYFSIDYNYGQASTTMNYFPYEGWNRQWEDAYSNVMSVIYFLENDSVNVNYPNFWAWAKLLRVAAMHRITDTYGPIIYSKYGRSGDSDTDIYDSQEDVYNTFFTELDEAIDTLTVYEAEGSTAFAKFDLVYGGDIAPWIKFANSLRLELAMRIVKANATLAQEQAEKACSNSYGLIESNDDNLNIDLGSITFPLYYYSRSWGETRMSATMESILGGYNDPRIAAYFDAVSDSITLISTGEKTGEYIDQYKGIMSGMNDDLQAYYRDYSAVNTDYVETATSYPIMNAAEVAFLRAEGELRGWDMDPEGTKTAEDFYNEGIELSFNQWGVSGAESYESDATSTFKDYVDPQGLDNFTKRSDITIAWESGATNEENLERIITQKWIAMWPDGQRAWSEFRRTGYPKLVPVADNNSSGVIADGDFVRRVNYQDDLYSENANAVAYAVSLLGGPDNFGTRVWWDVDTDGTNF